MLRIYSVDGNIGSGKSTLLENLRSQFKDNTNVIFLREPVDDWEEIKDLNGVTMLHKFYADQAKYSFPFQMMAYISRLAILKDAVESIKIQDRSSFVIITERSLFTDKMVFAKMLYDDGKIEDVNYQIYLKWFSVFADDYPIHRVIYVKTDPDVCSSRINKRAREGEVGTIPLEYLQNCHKYHNDMMRTVNCIETPLILNGNETPDNVTDQLSNLITEIKMITERS